MSTEFERQIEEFVSNVGDKIVLDFFKKLDENVDREMVEFLTNDFLKPMIENTIRASVDLMLKHIIILMDGKEYRLILN